MADDNDSFTLIDPTKLGNRVEVEVVTEGVPEGFTCHRSVYGYSVWNETHAHYGHGGTLAEALEDFEEGTRFYDRLARRLAWKEGR